MEDTHFCRKCRKLIEPGDEFCTGCGAPFKRKTVPAKIEEGREEKKPVPVKIPFRDTVVKFAVAGFLIGFTIFFISSFLLFYRAIHPALAGLTGGVIFFVAAGLGGKRLRKTRPHFIREIDRVLPTFPKYGFFRNFLDFIYTRFPSLKKYK